MTLAWQPGNSHLVRLRALRDVRTDTYITGGATVTAEIWPRGGTAPLTGGDLTLTYDGVPGSWSGVYPHTVPLVDGRLYELRITVDGGSPTARGHWRADLAVAARRVPAEDS